MVKVIVSRVLEEDMVKLFVSRVRKEDMVHLKKKLVLHAGHLWGWGGGGMGRNVWKGNICVIFYYLDCFWKKNSEFGSKNSGQNIQHMQNIQ